MAGGTEEQARVRMSDGLTWEWRTHEDCMCLAGCGLVHGIIKVEDKKAWAAWQLNHSLKSTPIRVVSEDGVDNNKDHWGESN